MDERTPATEAWLREQRDRGMRGGIFVVSAMLAMALGCGPLGEVRNAAGVVTWAACFEICLVAAVWSGRWMGLAVVGCAPARWVLEGMILPFLGGSPFYVARFPMDQAWFGSEPCSIERSTGLPSCRVRRTHFCFGGNTDHPWTQLGASIATRARYLVTGDAPGRYVGPWLTEAQARTYAREAERVDPGELRDLFPGLYIEEHGSSVRVLHLDGAILLEWDEGAVVETYAEDAPVRVHEWPDSAI